MSFEKPRESTEYIWVELEIARGDVDDVYMAFTDPEDRPDDTDWEDALYVEPDDPDLGDGDNHWAAILVGPDDTEADLDLDPGDYQCWIKIEASPETIVRKTGVGTVD